MWIINISLFFAKAYQHSRAVPAVPSLPKSHTTTQSELLIAITSNVKIHLARSCIDIPRALGTFCFDGSCNITSHVDSRLFKIVFTFLTFSATFSERPTIGAAMYILIFLKFLLCKKY
jgi:hypothetical protein